MTIEDPFAEPAEAERTVIRPNPGGRQPAAPAAPPSLEPQVVAAPVKPVALPPLAKLNPLINAALPLLDLAVQIKNRAIHNDIESLRDRVIEEINAFER